MTSELTYLIEKLLKRGAFVIGSRALGVADKESDWDLAILRTMLPEELNTREELNPIDYFSVLPMHNNSLICIDNKYGIKEIDILIYDNEDDFYAVRTALTITKTCPTILLQHKPFRVLAFELALKSTGRFREVTL